MSVAIQHARHDSQSERAPHDRHQRHLLPIIIKNIRGSGASQWEPNQDASYPDLSHVRPSSAPGHDDVWRTMRRGNATPTPSGGARAYVKSYAQAVPNTWVFSPDSPPRTRATSSKVGGACVSSKRPGELKVSEASSVGGRYENRLSRGTISPRPKFDPASAPKHSQRPTPPEVHCDLPALGGTFNEAVLAKTWDDCQARCKPRHCRGPPTNSLLRLRALAPVRLVESASACGAPSQPKFLMRPEPESGNAPIASRLEVIHLILIRIRPAMS